MPLAVKLSSQLIEACSTDLPVRAVATVQDFWGALSPQLEMPGRQHGTAYDAYSTYGYTRRLLGRLRIERQVVPNSDRSGVGICRSGTAERGPQGLSALYRVLPCDLKDESRIKSPGRIGDVCSQRLPANLPSTMTQLVWHQS